ncbi:MAG TPA: hypothetical protein VH480_02170 [Streptosporangiaceae bacterium]
MALDLGPVPVPTLALVSALTLARVRALVSALTLGLRGALIWVPSLR